MAGFGESWFWQFMGAFWLGWATAIGGVGVAKVVKTRRKTTVLSEAPQQIQ